MSDREELLDELARVFARAAVDRLLASEMKAPSGEKPPGAESDHQFHKLNGEHRHAHDTRAPHRNAT